MKTKKKFLPAFLSILFLTTAILGGCSSSTANKNPEKEKKEEKVTQVNQEVTLVLGAYTVPKEAFQAIIPLFKENWKNKTGQTVQFKESYEASGAQARAISEGFEADIAALSLEGDIDKITEKGFISHDWKSKSHQGMITSSVVALGVREGNPKQIKDWKDLTKPGIQVLYPNPKTSGGAQWDINAIYGAGLKISEEKNGKKDPEFAKKLLTDIHKNLKSLDKSGRASMTTFEKGVGDVVVTYENELLARVIEGQKYEIIIPKYTILIENPVALIDKNVDKHGVRKVAEAFIEFLWTKEAQKIFAEKGFRPVDTEVAKEFESQYKHPEGLFDIQYLGGWTEIRKEIYGKQGIWDQVLSGK